MRCPYCHDNDDKVIDSRESEGGKVVRRRRECKSCGKRFSSRERIEETTRLTVIKKDNSRVPFDRSKLLTGLQRACYKRPVPTEVLTKTVEEVEEELLGRGEREVAGIEIGRIMADRLKGIDAVAYLRFASVYMQFKDLDDLIAEAEDVKSQQRPGEGQGKLF
ncbi:transcriptional regulator NrdR [Poriferisphaera sp. WC338]|uniref:transcriptional regulator NrdR n=1 Tax=Poriferisphaera sp. WC338 TaxID=3425129 RepID=UPI003D812724